MVGAVLALLFFFLFVHISLHIGVLFTLFLSSLYFSGLGVLVGIGMNGIVIGLSCGVRVQKF